MSSTIFTRRRVATAAVLAVAVTAGLGASSALAADPRLDMADDALQKAKALVEASSSGGGLSPRAQRQFDRALKRAIRAIENAREEIVDAKEIVDNP